MKRQVEQARPEDFLAIAALDRIAWGDAPFIVDGEHVWRVWCEYATVLVVRRADTARPDAEKIAAALVMFPTHGGELFLHKIMAHPACRRQGMGTTLMEAALARATAPVLLTVDPANKAAVELYRKYGFTLREHVKGYYRSQEHRDVMAYHPAGH